MASTTYLSEWQFKDSKSQQWLQAQVPGTVHMDLYHNQKISHPYEEKNELDLQWIDKLDWQYKAELRVTPEMLAYEHIDLIFEGLDTYCTVSVNDQIVLQADNMFRKWQADIKGLVHEGKNEVLLHFHSPITVGLEKLAASQLYLPAPNDDSQLGGLEDKQVSVYIRKAPYHFGWDWGPRFVTSGIWKMPKIACWSTFQIEDVYIQQNQLSKDEALLTAHVTVESAVDQTTKIAITAENIQEEQEVSLSRGRNSIAIPLRILQPRLWWTHDLGEQHFYEFHAAVSNQEGHTASRNVRTGLRSISLVQKEDEKGKTFQFELNDVPLFMRGANHIPLDVFLPDITEERYIAEIDSALEANMNMLRVWGGGIYEKDIFYDYCDEVGILVWQDFMFACSMYPGDSAFLENVAIELEENITRLRNHPSIALWCGNNEIDSMWKEYEPNDGRRWKEMYPPEQREVVWNAYDLLFYQLIPEKLAALHPDHNYWPSSPMAELTYDGEQHAAFVRHRGDIHYWNVWHSHAPIEDYNHYIGRFMSEYGFQSFPEVSTYRKITDTELSLDSTIVNHHQKNRSGNSLILRYLNNYYKKPTSFEGYVYLSQLLQGYAFDTAIRAHRRAMPYCMGTLYWQINDAWPGASWSTIDYYGNWKSSHYAVKRAYQNTILASVESDNSLQIFGISDLTVDHTYTLSVKQYPFSENQPLKEEQLSVHLPKHASTLLYQIPLENLQQHAYIYMELLSEASAEPTATYIHSSVSFKEVDLPIPTITYEAEQTESGIAYTLTADTFAKGVRLDTQREGHFHDNYFDLVPHTPYTVFFHTDKTADGDIPDLLIHSTVDFI